MGQSDRLNSAIFHRVLTETPICKPEGLVLRHKEKMLEAHRKFLSQHEAEQALSFYPEAWVENRNIWLSAFSGKWQAQILVSPTSK